ncbi:MAG: ATP-binding protein [Leptolyngbyaceae cyanobacterium MO_188.B28]|nr:ATP-binding protein [Leptolyngbyaceae cyanobacterium MO_188.B28]
MQQAQHNGASRTTLSLSVRRTWRRLPVRYRGLAIIAIPIGCLMTSLGVLGWLQLDIVEDEALVRTAQRVNSETTRLRSGLAETQLSVQSYALTEQQRFLESYQVASLEIKLALEALEELVIDTPHQRKQIRQIRQLTDQRLFLMTKVLANHDESDPSVVLGAWIEQSEAIHDQAELKLKQFAAEELRIFDQHRRHLEKHQRTGILLVGVFATVGAIAAVLAAQLFFQLDRELAKRQARLGYLNQQLQQKNEQLQRFAANASHELRTPLAAMLSNAQVGLMAPPKDPVQPRKRLEKIAELAKSMSTLVGQLLFLARNQRRLTSEELTEIDLVELLRQVAQSYSERVTEKKVQFTCQLPPDAIKLAAQPDLLRQAVLNLLENAHRYTPAYGSITLRLKPQLKDILIQVEDTGIGIPPESLTKIFEQFYRVEQTQTKAVKGFGLGLAIVQQIVQTHGGGISVKSTVGKGSIFQIKLPSIGAC